MSKKTLPAPEFIKGPELAAHMRISLVQLTRWTAEGIIPPPWVRPGERTRLWRTKHFREFVETGRWPEESWKGFQPAGG